MPWKGEVKKGDKEWNRGEQSEKEKAKNIQADIMPTCI